MIAAAIILTTYTLGWAVPEIDQVVTPDPAGSAVDRQVLEGKLVLQNDKYWVKVDNQGMLWGPIEGLSGSIADGTQVAVGISQNGKPWIISPSSGGGSGGGGSSAPEVFIGPNAPSPRDQQVFWIDTDAVAIPVSTRDKNYIHDQTSPNTIWNVAHGLGKFAAVDVVDSGGSVVMPNISYVDDNNIQLTFGSATSGKAYVN